MSFKEMFEYGKNVETLLSKFTLANDYCIVPTAPAQIKRFKGPRVETVDGQIIATDKLLVINGRAIFAEDKGKEVFTWTRRQDNKGWSTGIDLHVYQEYKALQKRTEVAVWIFFFHRNDEPSPIDKPYLKPGTKCPTGLFAQSLSVLMQLEDSRTNFHEGEYTKNGRTYPMVYWNRWQLRYLASLDEVIGLKRLATMATLSERIEPPKNKPIDPPFWDMKF